MNQLDDPNHLFNQLQQQQLHNSGIMQGDGYKKGNDGTTIIHQDDNERSREERIREALNDGHQTKKVQRGRLDEQYFAGA